MKTQLSRRSVLQAAAASTGFACSSVWPTLVRAESSGDVNSRPQIALIGAGWRSDIKRQGRGIAIGRQSKAFGDLVAISEVDTVAAKFANQTLASGKADLYVDYRELLERDDIDAVLIATPDHWHAKMSIDAMRAGKDVYCEKPATVTIREGQQMTTVARETKKILQVGTQQRTESNGRFATAVAMVRAGRIGQLQRVKIGVDPGLTGGPFKSSQPPQQLNWDLWQGPAAEAAYIPERTHWTFRWWYEYAGGKLTDWGAHHVDIAQWAMNALDSGPTKVSGTGQFQMPYEAGMPTRSDMYNTPSTFSVDCEFAGGVVMTIDSGSNGILFEGTEGRFFVNRGKLTGTPVEALKNRPLPADAIEQLYGGPRPASHMQHFFDSIQNRTEPVSDIATHHRTITTCHLANLALRLGRDLRWDPAAEQFIDDEQANSFVGRTQRTGFEIDA